MLSFFSRKTTSTPWLQGVIKGEEILILIQKNDPSPKLSFHNLCLKYISGYSSNSVEFNRGVIDYLTQYSPEFKLYLPTFSFTL